MGCVYSCSRNRWFLIKDVRWEGARGKSCRLFLLLQFPLGGKQCKDHRKPMAHWLWKTSQHFWQPSASFFNFSFGSFENRAGSPEPMLTQGQEGWEEWRRRTRTSKLCSPKLSLSFHPTYRRRVARRGPARLFTILISCLHGLPSGASGKEPIY